MDSLFKTKPIVSVIIPVYNAADTLDVGLNSIRSQVYKELEIIFINDCSKDNSLDLLLAFQSELKNEGLKIKIHSHNVNQGVAVARNTGLELATGDYIVYLDADDILDERAISECVEIAVSKDLDILGFNWYLGFKESRRLMNQPNFETPFEAITLMLSGLMRWNLWLFFVKRELYETNNFRFIPKMNMGEDLMMTVKLFTVANKVHYLNKPFYTYRQVNDNSLTKQYTLSHMAEVSENLQVAQSFLEKSIYKNQLGNLVNYLKLNIKLPLLISDSNDQYKKWLNWFPESNSYVTDNKLISWRIRSLQWLALNKFFWLLRFYHIVVTKFVYGFIYR